ncbi:MAG: hypothetical protein D6732_12350 [Methanobacteriota archaeon]|nr:MAG: hypothetical protein D6732_12350 [Euryarchaeota archaeon]
MASPELELKRHLFVAQKADKYTLLDPQKGRRGKAYEFAKDLADAKVDKANIHGLESLAWSTESIADILDYIRVRVGRDNRWTKNNDVGIRLANVLETDLRKDAEEFYASHTPEDEDAIRRLHLDLCREFISHLRSLYEFHKARRGKDDEEES